MRKPNKLESLNTNEVIKQAGFVEFLDAGFPYYSPVGQKIKMNLEKALSDSCEENDFTRVLLPSVHRKKLVEDSGKYDEFRDEFVNVKSDYVLTATS